MLQLDYLIFFFILYGTEVVTINELSIGDKCGISSTNSSGECTLQNDCKTEDVQPQLCGFDGSEPIVCCQEEKSNEISKLKCEEYAKYAYQKIYLPALIGEKPRIKYVFVCAHNAIPLIIGGEPAKKGEFPHMAIIGYEDTNGEIKWGCGGSIISEEFILTAAHCLSSNQYGPAKQVRVGVTNLNSRARSRQDIKIKEMIKHPSYQDRSYHNDIGLLKLEKPIQMSPSARPACLYTSRNVQAHRAIASGWGKTTVEGEGTDDLQKVILELVTNEYCAETYKEVSQREIRNGIVEDMQICAGNRTEDKDTCKGDSGGPLQIYHVGDTLKCMYDIIGVTSFGKGCVGGSGVYSRVSHYIEWIEDIVWPSG